MSEPFKVALLVFPGLTQLDLIGPQEVFTRVRGVTAVRVWKDRAPLRSASSPSLLADHAGRPRRLAGDGARRPGRTGQACNDGLSIEGAAGGAKGRHIDKLTH